MSSSHAARLLTLLAVAAAIECPDETWLKLKRTSPKTGVLLEHDKVTQNHSKRGEIIEFVEQHERRTRQRGRQMFTSAQWLKQARPEVQRGRSVFAQRATASKFRFVNSAHSFSCGE